MVNLKQRECPPPSKCSKHSGLGITYDIWYYIHNLPQFAWCWWDRGFFEKLFLLLKSHRNLQVVSFFILHKMLGNKKWSKLANPPHQVAWGMIIGNFYQPQTAKVFPHLTLGIVKHGMFGNRLSKHGLKIWSGDSLIYPERMDDGCTCSVIFFVRKSFWNNEQDV